MFVIVFLYENFRLSTIPFAWWSWLLILFADDFCYYWAHRMGHEIRFFWASHIVHHSSQKYNLSTALRQTWTGGFFSFIFYLILPIIGFHPLMIFTQMSIGLLYQYWIHTELIYKMPRWFETIFNTPSHHRVHHGSNPLYLDRNHAGIFIVWDKLFGTFQEELPEIAPVYGISRPARTWNPIKINFQHVLLLVQDAWHADKWEDKLKIWFMPTGWRPADMMEKYPLKKIEDVYAFEKYDPPSSPGIRTWSMIQLVFLLLFISYLFGNLAPIGSPGIFLYGLFIFLYIPSINFFLIFMNFTNIKRQNSTFTWYTFFI